MSSLFRTKPLSCDDVGSSGASSLKKDYTLSDLLAVGVGGTVGSGVFVLSGLIAADVGPATPISFLIGGCCCIFSAASYAELSERLPSSGAAYTFIYHTLGEFPAFLAAAMLTLEYGVAAAAVAVSWGDKLGLWLSSEMHVSAHSLKPLGLNVSASLLQLACVLVLLMGVGETKLVVNTATVAKLALVGLMTLAGFMLLEPRFFSLSAFHGVTLRAILRGSMHSFFAFLGYDEVCFLSAESKSRHSLPAAVFLTLAIVTLLYFLSAVALVGMRERNSISRESGFIEAFSSHGGFWSGFAQFVALGELVSLPLVVLISFLAQPRLQYALALDGLLPRRFAQLDARGNLAFGIITSGVLCVGLALTVPFDWLDDVISAAVLCSFNLINASLIVLRKGRRRREGGAGEQQSWMCRAYSHVPPTIAHLLAFHAAAFVVTMVASLSTGSTPASDLLLCLLGSGVCLHSGIRLFLLPDDEEFAQEPGKFVSVSSSFPSRSDGTASAGSFRVFGVPWTPLAGSVINYILLAQLHANCFFFLLVFFGCAAALYLFSSRLHSNLQPASPFHSPSASSSLDASTSNILSKDFVDDDEA